MLYWLCFSLFIYLLSLPRLFTQANYSPGFLGWLIDHADICADSILYSVQCGAEPRASNTFNHRMCTLLCSLSSFGYRYKSLISRTREINQPNSRSHLGTARGMNRTEGREQKKKKKEARLVPPDWWIHSCMWTLGWRTENNREGSWHFIKWTQYWEIAVRERWGWCVYLASSVMHNWLGWPCSHNWLLRLHTSNSDASSIRCLFVTRTCSRSFVFG